MHPTGWRPYRTSPDWPRTSRNVSTCRRPHPRVRRPTAPSWETAGGSPMLASTLSAIEPEWLDPAHAMHTVALPGIEPWRHGKVRSIYEAGPDHLIIVASDRLSAY